MGTRKNRRQFVRLMAQACISTLLAGCYPAVRVLSAVRGEKGGGVDARDLKNLTLREMARRRLHHGPGGRFVNTVAEGTRERGLGRVLYWKLFHTNRFRPFLADQPVKPVRIDWRPVREHRGLSITWINHASLLIRDVDRTILVDPVFDGLMWFIRDHTPLAFDIDEMPPVDQVLVTHGHYDHLDKASLSRLAPDTRAITPLGYEAIFSGLGMTRHTRLDWFDTFRDGGRSITLLPCNHWTMRNPFSGPDRNLWGSFLIETASGRTIYLSGDTAWFDGFREIGREYDIDLAVFNLGAYEPRWFMARSHMDPRETVRAFKALNARRLMIVHWGTFRLGDEPVHFPPLDLKKVLAEEGLSDRWLNLEHGRTHFL